ncbi:MAG: squalene--hopene cyclase [Candidatus Anammoxibacter sp.]
MKYLFDFFEKISTKLQKYNGNTNHEFFDSLMYDLKLDNKSHADDIEGALKEDGTDLDAAINRTQRYFLSVQNHVDGHWYGVLEADSSLTAEYLMLMHFLDRLDPEKEKKAINYILSKQLDDGGWNIYYNGPSEISVSVKAYFVLKLAGYTEDDPVMRKAVECILGLGGIMASNCFTKIHLAIFGHFDWRGVPTVPVEMIVFPRFVYFNLNEISYWSRCIVIPLSIITALKPNCHLGDHISLDELYVIPRDKVSYRMERDHGKLSWRNFFLDVADVFKRYEKAPIKFIRKIATDHAERWMLQHSEHTDGLGAIWPAMVNTVVAMKCLGYEENNRPEFTKAVKDIEDLVVSNKTEIHVQPCVSPVWDTPWSILALLESGVPHNHPALVKAGTWLLGKEVRKIGDWQHKNPHVEPSGWYFQYANEFFPDNDDTAVVLMSLHGISMPEGSGKEKVIIRGLKWLLGMQNDDGGWGSFDRNSNRTVFNHIPFSDWAALLDPSTSDLTARCLDLIGNLGMQIDLNVVRRALRFLKSEQESDGSWFGRWGVNYIYGTWSVLSGLSSIGEDMSQDYIQKSVEWIKRVQNNDGGWGESCKSYENSKLKAIGPSTASQTAWSLLGLFAAGDFESESVIKGVKYLLDTQVNDGTWAEEEYTGTGFPTVFYLKYHMYPKYFPLLALSRYRNLSQNNVH